MHCVFEEDGAAYIILRRYGCMAAKKSASVTMRGHRNCSSVAASISIPACFDFLEILYQRAARTEAGRQTYT
jgi:hypothetical protein